MRAEDIHGFMGPDELDYLRERARQAKLILEIGSWHGRSTYAMAEVCPGTVHAIDDFGGCPEDGNLELKYAIINGHGAAARLAFHKNLREFLQSGRVILHEALSLMALSELHEMVNQGELERFDFAFIDGAHDYPNVAIDVEGAKRLVRSGGIIAGHDRDYPGVEQAIDLKCPGWTPKAAAIWEWVKP